MSDPLVLTAQLLGGLVLLVAAGDVLVRGAVGLARRLGVSPLLIGLAVVGFGTSTPELVTSLQAALIHAPGIAIGNVVGSNIANILLILGVAALIRPLAVEPKALGRDGTMLVVATLAGTAAMLSGHLPRPVGVAFLVMLVGYVGYSYRRERTSPDAAARMHAEEAEIVPPLSESLWAALSMTLGGLVLTILGAHLLVEGAVELATAAGISETVVGLTVVAIGTSLPELVASSLAALRRQGDVALGNVIGSNIYNLLGILGATALVEPIPVPPDARGFDLWAMVAVTAVLIVFARTGRRITRLEAGLLLAGYGAYLTAQVGALPG